MSSKPLVQPPDAADSQPPADLVTLTPLQFAQRLQVTRRSVDRAIARGQIRFIKLGRYVRIPATEIERLARTR